MLPKTLLRKLYVKGSLTTTEEGWKFTIKNTLANGTLTSFIGIKIDNEEIDISTVSVETPDGIVGGNDATPENPIPLNMGQEVTISIGSPMPPGDEHKIEVTFNTKEVGKIEFDIQDTIS